MGLEDKDEERVVGAKPLGNYRQEKIEAKASGAATLADEERVIEGGGVRARGDIAWA
jgi:hypothetical protein